ncbi:hypothetical protein MGN70_009847 [Eutypa lata]|nr:hypothetical protein MGN70_009847 [Eutypa lata]
MPEAQTVVRGSLRYDGNPQLVKALIGMRRLDVEPKDWLRLGITWAHAQQKATSAVSTSESDLMTKIEELCKCFWTNIPQLPSRGLWPLTPKELCDVLREKAETEGIKLVEKYL